MLPALSLALYFVFSGTTATPEPRDRDVIPVTGTLEESSWFAEATARIQEIEARFQPLGGGPGFGATNHRQGLHVATEGAEVVLRPLPGRQGHDWSAAVSVGPAGVPHDLTPRWSAEGASLRRIGEDTPITLTSDPEGLHFEITLREPSPGPVCVETLVRTSLTPQASGQTLVWHDESGQAQLRFRTPTAIDAQGRALAVSMKTSPAATGGHSVAAAIHPGFAAFPVHLAITMTGFTGSPNPPVDWCNTGTQVSEWYGYSVTNAGDVNDDGYEDVLIGAPLHSSSPGRFEGRVFAYYGSASGLATVHNWEAAADMTTSSFGWSVAGLGDVNGDGVDDIAIGSPFYSTDGLSKHGAVFVWYGSSAGLNLGVTGDPSNADWSAVSTLPTSKLGWAVARAGDINGDGFQDILAGAPGFDNNPATWTEGAALLWYGSASGPNGGVKGDVYGAPWMAEGDVQQAQLGKTLSTAGDFDGDGYDDFVVAADHAPGDVNFSGRIWFYAGGAGGPANGRAGASWTAGGADAGDFYGAALVGDFDCNRDGYPELAIGIPGANAGNLASGGAVSVISGGPGGYSWYHIGEDQNEQFGSRIAAGDFNGDGLDDLVASAPVWGDLGAGIGAAGRVKLFYGHMTTLLSPVEDWVFQGDGTSGRAGDALAFVNVNDDGADDLLIGAPKYSDVLQGDGKVWMFLGTGPSVFTDNCLAPDPATIIDAPGGGLLYPGSFGQRVANAGDVNGDGYEDVIVGAPGYGASQGSIFLFQGSAGGLSTTPSFIQTGFTNYLRFGTSVDGAGDINGDGYDDVIVGASGWGGGFPAIYVNGGAWVYYGGPFGLGSSLSEWTAISSNQPDRFGWTVAGAGDVDGDGYHDVLVGAPGYQKSWANDPWPDIEGAAYLWYGTPSGVNGGVPGDENNWDWKTTSDVVYWDYFAWSMGCAGDVDQDGFDDLIVAAPGRDLGTDLDQGEVYVYRGSAQGPIGGQPGTPYNASDTLQGTQEGENLGWSVTGADVNGDGYDDVLVGAPGHDPGTNPRAGAVVGWYGSATGPGDASDFTLPGDRDYAELGRAVAALDYDGDGIPDVAGGAWQSTNTLLGQGRVFLFLGSSNGPCTTSHWCLDGTEYREILGAAVAGADVNQDGFGDLIVGSPRYPVTVNGIEGRITVWHGTDESVLEMTDQVVTGAILTIRFAGGRPGAPVLLYSLDINGVPLVRQWVSAVLDADGYWEASFVVPAGLENNDVTFIAFSGDCRGKVVQSNTELVEFR